MLHAAVEEKRDVRVFFGFSDTQLPKAMHGQHIGQGIAQVFGNERDPRIQAGIGLAQADEFRQHRTLPALKTGKAVIDITGRQLARSVGAEIHEYHGIAVLHRGGLRQYRGLHELVAFATGIGLLQSGLR